MAIAAALAASAWAAAEYGPELDALLDPPKTLEQLKADAKSPADGYHIHHIVEEQADSVSDDANSKRFADDQLNGPDNLVRAPQLAHEEISRWYSTGNPEYGGMSPRAYIRANKLDWDNQYQIGLKTLRQYGVLK